jgi:hypothetical protein
VRLLKLFVVIASFVAVQGCAGSDPFRVKIGGEVLYAAKDAPRELKSGVFVATEADQVRKAAGGKIAPADRATVTITLQFGKERHVQHVLPIAPSHSKDAHFLFETKSDGFDELGEIRVTCEAAGRSTEIRRFTTPKGVAFEENLFIVLEEPGAVAPPNPLDAPSNATNASKEKK